MTTAERLEARGEARGELRGRAKILLRLIALKFGPSIEETARYRVENADADTLDRWAERILTADTLDDLLD